MITFNGKSYMFVYSKLSAGDLMVTALIPSDRLLEQSSGIKQLTTVLVIVCMIIALALGLFLSSQMTGTIKYILRQAAQSFQWKPYGSSFRKAQR